MVESVDVGNGDGCASSMFGNVPLRGDVSARATNMMKIDVNPDEERCLGQQLDEEDAVCSATARRILTTRQ